MMLTLTLFSYVFLLTSNHFVYFQLTTTQYDDTYFNVLIRCMTAFSFYSSSDMPAKENVIQVMTAERREYSRPKGKFDVTMSMPPPSFNVVNEPFYPEDNFSYGYEPTQEQQWNNDNVGWVPSGIKELTPGPQMVPPPHINMNMPPPSA